MGENLKDFTTELCSNPSIPSFPTLYSVNGNFKRHNACMHA